MASIAFLITIDTEGDNLWARPKQVETKNAGFLPRFQSLCERFGFKPTYLTDYEMAKSAEFIEFGKDVLKRGVGEIGMHLHGWDTPPIEPLTHDDVYVQPYLTEYAEPLMRAKVRTMTGLLEEGFGVKAVSHRGGRWAMDGRYAQVLVDEGYRVDCSLTPNLTWHKGVVQAGAMTQGLDYTHVPEDAYYVDLDDPRKPGRSTLLEAPLTSLAPILPFGGAMRRWCVTSSSAVRKVVHSLYPHRTLRPTLWNRKELHRILAVARREHRSHVEFVLHSSEFMPGGSPYFPNEAAIERLYESIEALFEDAKTGYVGRTLAEFEEGMRNERGAA